MTEKKISTKKILLLLIALLAAISVVFVAYHFGKSSNSAAAESTNGITVADDEVDWDKELNALSGQETNGIKIPGYGELTVAAKDTNWKISLVNPKDNDCYFKYSITIDDSEEPIYESDYIEPGKAITEFEVSKGLEAGEYKIHLNIASYSMDGNNTRMNGADVQADLHVVG